MAQLQIKGYLERNKIGSLFEDLMARLIRDQPEDPLTYIRNTIQRKVEQRDGPEAAAASLSQTLPTGYLQQRSNSISSDSEKAKRSSSLSKTQPVQSAGAPRQSSSNLTGKPGSATSSSTNLDELFAGTRSLKRDAKGDASVSKSATGAPSRAAPAAVQLDISEEALAKWAPQQAGPINIGYYGPVKREKKAEEGELQIAKKSDEKKKTELSADDVKEMKAKQKSKNAKESNSKAELAKMVAQMEEQDRATQAQLRALQSQSVHPHRDDADELSEDDDALAREGVKKDKDGKKDDKDKDKKKKKKKQDKPKKENAQVRFSVCKLCAKMLEPQDEAGSQPSARVVWTGQPLPSSRAPLLDSQSLNQAALPAGHQAPLPSNAQTLPAAFSDGRSQLEILQNLGLGLGLTSEDIATGRVSPYWKNLQGDVSDVEEVGSARASARPPARPSTGSARPTTGTAASRRAPRSSQEFFNQ